MIDPKSNYQQQGDVLFFDEKTVPADAKKVPSVNGSFVLREGEATGHAHRVEAQDVELYEDGSGTLWLSTSKPVEVTHEEHGAVTVGPGVVRIGTVEEYDHFEEEIREVRD